MQYSVDYFKIFDGLPEPIALCDEAGVVKVMNSAAAAFLAPTGDEPVEFELTARETVRQMRLTTTNAHEFYLAEVKVANSARDRVSVSLAPLNEGGYRLLISPAGTSGTAPNLRMLESLVNVNRHLGLFRTPDKVAALFASSFGEVFPEYSFYLEAAQPGHPRLTYTHHGWDDGARVAPGAFDFELPHVPAEGLLFTDSSRGYRIALDEFGEFDGFCQVERVSDHRFGVSEREGFEVFLQQLLFALSRVWQREQEFSAVEPIINQLDAVVIVCDSRRRIRVANRTFESLVIAEEILGRDILEFFSESTQNQLRTAAASVMAGGAAESFEAAVVNGDGSSSSQVILNIQVSPNVVSGGASTAGFIVTGQMSEVSIVELEQRLSRAEHLMNLGELASGVAHELKNPLTSILNYAEYLLRKYEDSLFEERDTARLQRIIQGVEHIEEFIQDLMTLARPEDNDWGEVDVHLAIRESAAMCEVPLRQFGVDLKLDFGAANSRIAGAHGQLRQVFVNLLTNAAKAMPQDGGQITVTTRVESGKLMCIVGDDGMGIAQENLEKVFEPFFTTREGAGGTGLGLAIVHNIVRRHAGTVTVESERGAGTRFIMSFPSGSE